MTEPTKKIRAHVVRAAELRAAGFPWQHVAQELKRKRKTVEQWPAAYREFWDAQLAIARADLRAAAGDESIAVLRTLLRSEDEKVKQAAARELLPEPELTDADPPRPSDLHRLADFLEGLTDDELRVFLGDDRPHDASRSGTDRLLEAAPASTA